MDQKRAQPRLPGREQADPVAPAGAAKAPLVELFWSVQGEGRHVGVPMAFLRVATCPLRCLYCDTPNSYQAPARVPVRLGPREPGEPNPVTAERAAALVQQLVAVAGEGVRPARVSVTGGEPLVFPGFVREFGRLVRAHGVRVHLETAAIDPEALAQCVDQVDHLSADYKLPETLGAPADPAVALPPGGSYGERHRRCCELALRRGATVDVKLVLTDQVGDAAVERALAELAPVRERILLVLQPVTPFGAVTRPLPRAELERFLAMALRARFDVRVLPQVHKTLHVP